MRQIAFGSREYLRRVDLARRIIVCDALDRHKQDPEAAILVLSREVLLALASEAKDRSGELDRWVRRRIEQIGTFDDERVFTAHYRKMSYDVVEGESLWLARPVTLVGQP